MTTQRLLLVLTVLLALPGAATGTKVDLSGVPHAGVRIDIVPSRDAATLVLAGHPVARMRATRTGPGVYRIVTPAGRTLGIDLHGAGLSCLDGNAGVVCPVTFASYPDLLRVSLSGRTHPILIATHPGDTAGSLYLAGNRILALQVRRDAASGELALSTGQGLATLRYRATPLGLFVRSRDGRRTAWVDRMPKVDLSGVRELTPVLPLRWQATHVGTIELALSGWKSRRSIWQTGRLSLGGHAIGLLRWQTAFGGVHIASPSGNGNLSYKPATRRLMFASRRGAPGQVMAACSAHETGDTLRITLTSFAAYHIVFDRKTASGSAALFFRGQPMAHFSLRATSVAHVHELATHPTRMYFDARARPATLFVHVRQRDGSYREQTVAQLSSRD